MDPYRHVISFALDHPWAVTRPVLGTIADILARRIMGERAIDPEVEARLRSRDRLPQPASGGGGVAVIPVHGVMIPRGDAFRESSGAISIESIVAMLREAAGNEAVSQIVMDIDSPGGSVAGATELSREMLRIRAKKPIVAVANYTMASCAYWMGAAATEVVASPSAAVGSIGVYGIHDDLSKALEAHGIKRTYITAGKFKAAGNETEPLSDEARAMIQARINEHYDQMVGDISKGRGVAVDQVRSQYGEGKILGADEALKLGMIDKIATLDETIARLTAAAPSRGARGDATVVDARGTAQDPPAADTAQDFAANGDRFRAQFERELLSTYL